MSPRRYAYRADLWIFFMSIQVGHTLSDRGQGCIVVPLFVNHLRFDVKKLEVLNATTPSRMIPSIRSR